MIKIMKLKKSKMFKASMIAIRILVAVIFVGFLVVTCLQRFSDNKISFFDYRMFTVITGSMKPKYNVGDVLISKKVAPSAIKVGDTVSYLGAVGDFNGKVITHEVVGIKKDENGKYAFRTKGLANLVEDPVISESQLYGVVVYKSLLLSTIYGIVGTSLGFYLLIIIPLMYVIGSEIINALLSKEEKRREQMNNSNNNI